MFVQVVDDLLVKRVMNSLFHFHVGIVEPHLPLIRSGEDDVAADEFRPVQVLAIGGSE